MLNRLYVSVQTVVYFKKCVSGLPSASGYPSHCCVLIYMRHLILKLQRNFLECCNKFEDMSGAHRGGKTSAPAHIDSLLKNTRRNCALELCLQHRKESHAVHCHCHGSSCSTWQNLGRHLALNVIIATFRKRTATA
jgi:hypothetical protein